MTSEIIADYANLSSMTVEQLAIQVALRQGLTIRGPLNEISWPPLEGVRPSWIRHCRVDEFLDAECILSLLDEVHDCGTCLHWVLEEQEKVSFTGSFMRPKDAINVSHSDFKVCIVLAWLVTFDKGLLK